jgi:hypothetical protein
MQELDFTIKGEWYCSNTTKIQCRI